MLAHNPEYRMMMLDKRCWVKLFEGEVTISQLLRYKIDKIA